MHTFEVLPSDPLEVKVQSIDAVEGLTFSESTLPTDSGSLLEVSTFLCLVFINNKI